MSPSHIPVFMDEVLELLSPHPRGQYVDATLGGAGHAGSILRVCAPDGRLLGIDADRQSIDSARETLSPFAGRVTLVCSYFDELKRIVSENGFFPANGILFDLGISSTQLEDEARGFSFQSNGPLDMRMGQSIQTTAAEMLRTASEEDLARIFHEYAEERYSRRIARVLVREREQRPILTAQDLARLVTHAVPRSSRSAQRIHPATRVFQALRIAVNDELDRLKRVLPDCISVLCSGGRLVVITFHSLEDRIVKQFMQSQARKCTCPPSVGECVCGGKPKLRILTKKPMIPRPDEVRANPRGRSAKLRAAEVI